MLWHLAPLTVLGILTFLAALTGLTALGQGCRTSLSPRQKHLIAIEALTALTALAH